MATVNFCTVYQTKQKVRTAFLRSWFEGNCSSRLRILNFPEGSKLKATHCPERKYKLQICQDATYNMQ